MSGDADTSAFVCLIDAIPEAQRPLHEANTRRLMASAQEVRILAKGYAWRFSNEAALLQDIAAFIGNERLCCPFFHFNLDVEPNQGPIWLSITGSTDIEMFLQSEGLMPAGTAPFSNDSTAS